MPVRMMVGTVTIVQNILGGTIESRPKQVHVSTFGTVQVDSVGTTLISPNADRLSCLVQCLGSPSIYVIPGSVLSTNSSNLQKHMSWGVDVFRGTVRAITAAGTVSAAYQEY